MSERLSGNEEGGGGRWGDYKAIGSRADDWLIPLFGIKTLRKGNM